MKKYLFLIILSLFLLAAVRVSPALGYNQTSPHWSHINVLDFGRNLSYQNAGAQKTAACNFFADKVDECETKNSATEVLLTARNPNMRYQAYDLDSTICLHVDCDKDNASNPELVGLPENYFLHFTDETVLDIYKFGVFYEQITIPAGGRIREFIWDDYRYIYNPKITAWQDWMINRLITNVDTNDSLFLDEHGPGWRYISGSNSVLVSGGHITEYGDKLPNNDQLDIDFNADVCTWLAHLKVHFDAIGKPVSVNTAGYSTNQLSIDRAVAVGGFHLEYMFRPDMEEYTQNLLIAAIKTVTDAGGRVDTHSSTGYYGPAEYTAGNYTSADTRYRMWRLAFYYIVKEAIGSSGMVYFDPTFYIKFGEDTSTYDDFFVEWETAFETNVGLPTALHYTYQTGNNPARLPDIVPYKIRARDYTNALVLVRTKDLWSDTEFGDPSAVTVNLPEGNTWHFLNANGTYGPAITSVSLRDSESAILLKTVSPDTTPPAAPTGVSVQ